MDEQKRYWGLWATIGFSFIVCFVFILVQVVAVVLLGDFIISTQPDKDPELVNQGLESNRLFLAITLLLTSIICSGLIVAFAALHRQTSVKEYLHFLPVTLRQLLPYMGLMLLFAASYNGLSYLLDKPIVPGFLITAYQRVQVFTRYSSSPLFLPHRFLKNCSSAASCWTACASPSSARYWLSSSQPFSGALFIRNMSSLSSYLLLGWGLSLAMQE